MTSKQYKDEFKLEATNQVNAEQEGAGWQVIALSGAQTSGRTPVP